MAVTCGDAIVVAREVVAVASAAATRSCVPRVAADLVVTMTRDRRQCGWQQEGPIRRWQQRCVQC
jgi:hypothetical protein